MRIIPLRPPDPVVVELLKSLLRQAEEGEIISLIYSTEVAGGHVQSGYTVIENAYSTIGQLERMKFLLLRELDETSNGMDLSE